MAPLPDYTLFRFFFVHVVRLQNAANALKAQGKKDLSARTLMRRKLHLTVHEDAVLEGLAANCAGAYSAASRSGVAAVKQILQQYPDLSAAPPEVVQQISDLETRRRSITTNCIANLQSQMGQLRFQMLYNFVVATEAPKIKRFTPTAPPGVTIPAALLQQ